VHVPMYMSIRFFCVHTCAYNICVPMYTHMGYVYTCLCEACDCISKYMSMLGMCMCAYHMGKHSVYVPSYVSTRCVCALFHVWWVAACAL
jgi:hypothetical protein